MISDLPSHTALAQPTRILFIHQNFPGQFRRIALNLSEDRNFDVIAIGKKGCPLLPGVRTFTYDLSRKSAKETHPYVVPLELGVLHGQAVARILLSLKIKGYAPDIIVAHPGWGETLFVKDVFPKTRLIHLAEFFYQSEGADLGFDPEFPVSIDDRARVKTKNALHLLNMENCDIAVAPTHWQKNLHPAAYRNKIEVIHEGIDCEKMRPDPTAKFTLPSGVVLNAGDRVITYVARNLEPYRGFHVFMRALPSILENNPECHVVIVGGDGVSYGKPPSYGENWRERMLAEVNIDSDRVHFLGQIPYENYKRVLQVSAVHVYLTYPFVLSWSFLEAMSVGCNIVASKTAPIEEVFKGGACGRFFEFFDIGELAKQVSDALHSDFGCLGSRSESRKRVVENYSALQGIDKYRDLIHFVSAGKLLRA